MVTSGLCHIEDYADYDRDFDAFMRELVLPDCPPPYFALAHSMGALECLRAVRDRRVRFERMVLLTPMLALSRVVSPPMGLVRAFSAVHLFLGRDRKPISRRPWARWRRLQPEREPRQLRGSAILDKAPALRTGVPTVRWVYASARAMKEARAEAFAKAVITPSLIITAGSDIVVANEPIANLAAAMRTGHRLIIPGARHEILMDTDPIREMFWAAFDAFIPGTPDDAGVPSAGKEPEYAVV
jgi:lysophospholipase